MTSHSDLRNSWRDAVLNKPIAQFGIEYKEIFFMNSDIKFLNIEWRTSHPLTNFEDRFGLRGSVIF